MLPERRIRDAALLLPIIGTVIFLPPYIRIFDQDASLGGVPILHVYVFLFWFFGIILTAVVARKLVRRDQPPESKVPPAIEPDSGEK